jgi:hypothetical protein
MLLYRLLHGIPMQSYAVHPKKRIASIPRVLYNKAATPKPSPINAPLKTTSVGAAAALVAEEAALPAAPVALVNAPLALDPILLPNAAALLAAPAAPVAMVESRLPPPDATEVATDSALLSTLAAPDVAALKADAAPDVAWLINESTCRSWMRGLPMWKLNAEATPNRAVRARVERMLVMWMMMKSWMSGVLAGPSGLRSRKINGMEVVLMREVDFP